MVLLDFVVLVATGATVDLEFRRCGGSLRRSLVQPYCCSISWRRLAEQR